MQGGFPPGDPRNNPFGQPYAQPPYGQQQYAQQPYAQQPYAQPQQPYGQPPQPYGQPQQPYPQQQYGQHYPQQPYPQLPYPQQLPYGAPPPGGFGMMNPYAAAPPHMTAGGPAASVGLFGRIPCPHCGYPTTSSAGGAAIAARFAGGLVGWLIVTAFAAKYYCAQHGEIPTQHFPPAHQSAISNRKAAKLIVGGGILLLVFAVMIIGSLAQN